MQGNSSALAHMAGRSELAQCPADVGRESCGWLVKQVSV